MKNIFLTAMCSFSVLVAATGCTSKTEKTTLRVPTKIVISSKTNLSEWKISPELSSSSKGMPMVYVDIWYQGTSGPVERVKVSVGNAQLDIKDIKNGQFIKAGTSIGNDTKLTVYMSWEEQGKHLTGQEILYLR